MKAIAQKEKKNYFLPEILVIILCVALMGILSSQTSSINAVQADQNKVIEDSEEDTTEIAASDSIEETGTPSTALAETTATTKLSPSHKISVPYISQENVLPTGCEIISSVMLLRYYHYNTTVDDFIDKYLDKQELTKENGIYYGPHPSEAFVGSPYREDGLGCYAPVIQKALNRVLKNEVALDTTGTSLDDLVRQYISNDQPVLVWASMNMIPLGDGFTYTIKSTDKKFTWPANEHCLVLIGYDQNKYYFNDPYKSNGVKGFQKSIVNKRFNEMGMQSVVVVKN